MEIIKKKKIIITQAGNRPCEGVRGEVFLFVCCRKKATGRSCDKHENEVALFFFAVYTLSYRGVFIRAICFFLGGEKQPTLKKKDNLFILHFRQHTN